MKNVKILSLNENDLLELKTSKERISLFMRQFWDWNERKLNRD